jgi:putative ABC transport system permease protein
MSFINDICYALRVMRRYPAPTVFAILILALGMGANTAMFTAAYAVLNSAALRSVRDPRTLVMLWEKNPAFMARIAQRIPARLGNYREWRRQSQLFEDMAAFSSFMCNLGAVRSVPGDYPKRVEAIQVERSFFNLLGAKPALGRVFTAEESHEAADRVILLSAALYKEQFGTATDLTGKTIQVNGVQRAVIGVLPENFQIPNMWEGTEQKEPQVWIPLDLERRRSQEELWSTFYFVYARLRQGISLSQARAEMSVIGDRLRREYPEPNKGFGVNVFPVAEEDTGFAMRRSMIVLQFAVGFVLLIACANVGNYLLARVAAREHEISIRLALGAQRSRITRLIFTESLLISALAGAVGLFVALWSISAISSLAPVEAFHLHELRMDTHVFGYAFVVVIATGLIFGAIPALHAARQDINVTIARSNRRLSGGSHLMRGGMIIGEGALAVMLLIGAGLMIRSLQMLMNVNLGFRTDHLLTANMILTNADGKQVDMQRAGAFGDQLLDRVASLPGVISASLSNALPMQSVSQTNYDVEGAPQKNNWSITNITRATETYFDTTGIQVKLGRAFTRAETASNKPGVVVVSESFAHLNWPNQDPLGKIVLLPGGDKPNRLTVIGIIADTRQMGPEGATNPEIYIPSRAYPDIYLSLRTTGDPMALAPMVKAIVSNISPAQPIARIYAMDRVLHEWTEEKRFYMFILVTFAGLALALTSLGLYGVLSYWVSLRTRELGVRMALGASAMEVFRLVVGQGLKLMLFGIAAGLTGALLLTHLMQALIFGISTKDPMTFGIAACIIAVVAFLATYLPARRATKIDPMESLRAD